MLRCSKTLNPFWALPSQACLSHPLPISGGRAGKQPPPTNTNQGV